MDFQKLEEHREGVQHRLRDAERRRAEHLEPFLRELANSEVRDLENFISFRWPRDKQYDDALQKRLRAVRRTVAALKELSAAKAAYPQKEIELLELELSILAAGDDGLRRYQDEDKRRLQELREKIALRDSETGTSPQSPSSFKDPREQFAARKRPWL